MNLEMPGTTTQTESQNQGGIFSNPEGIENEFSGRIRMEEFYNHPKFSREEIDRDIAECERRKAHYDKINHANSDGLTERILINGKKAEITLRKGISQGWLGADVEILDTSEYDDYINFIDEIIDIALDDEQFDHLGLSVDFATSNADVELKIQDTLEILDRGEIPVVKYFKSRSTGLDKNVGLPRLVIGASAQTVSRLAALEEEIENHTRVEPEAQKKLTEDVFKYILFGQIIAQLDVFCHRLEKVVASFERKPGRNSEQYRNSLHSLEVHRKAFDTIKILQEKSDASFEKISRHIKGDSTAVHIGQALARLKSMPIGSFKDHRRTR